MGNYKWNKNTLILYIWEKESKRVMNGGDGLTQKRWLGQEKINNSIWMMIQFKVTL